MKSNISGCRKAVKKQVLIMILTICMLFALLPAGAVAVDVTVSGTAVQWTDVKPFIDENDRTMVPLRAVAEALGLSVSWDGTKREASFTDGAKTICFPIGSSIARTGDGGTVPMDTAAVIRSDRTYAPIRYLAEYFGFTVGWDDATKTVLIGAGSESPAAGLDSATVSLTRMNLSYWDEDGRYGRVFVNCYYDLASITDDIPLRERINASLRSGYEAFSKDKAPYGGGYDEGKVNFTDALEGELSQNSDGILSVRYCRNWMMGGVGDGSISGVTVSLRTGERLYLSDLSAADGSAITFQRMEDLAVACYLERTTQEMISSMLPQFRQNDLDDLDFYIQGNQIILCIAKYELAEGAAGAAEIPTGIYIVT